MAGGRPQEITEPRDVSPRCANEDDGARAGVEEEEYLPAGLSLNS